MNVFFFHLMPYAPLDPRAFEEHGTTWITLPNAYYDPKVGAALYNRYLDELEYAEAIGFDGVAVNEHHQTAYGLMPSPIVTASALARRTKRAKIGIFGSAALLRANPLSIAEEHAMIDNISNGRLISAFVRGVGTEYFIWNVNPTESYERFVESHDLIVRAWASTEPFEHHGKHFHFPYVNLWPRPYQQPHPPIWAPTNGSSETVEFAAAAHHRYTYLQAYNTEANTEKYFRLYQETANRNGWTATPDRLGWAGPIFVGRTDREALELAKPHVEALFNVFLPKPVQTFFPPGYVTPASLQAVRSKNRQNMAGGTTAESLIESGIFLCGSPETIAKQMRRYMESYGFSNWLLNMQFGTLTAELTKSNMDLFAEHVLPELRRSPVAA